MSHPDPIRGLPAASHRAVRRLRERTRLTVVEVLDTPPEDWTGESGYLTAELITRYLPRPRDRRRRQWFVCGPPPMIVAVLRALDGLGVPREVVHTELFGMV